MDRYFVFETHALKVQLKKYSAKPLAFTHTASRQFYLSTWDKREKNVYKCLNVVSFLEISDGSWNRRVRNKEWERGEKWGMGGKHGQEAVKVLTGTNYKSCTACVYEHAWLSVNVFVVGSLTCSQVAKVSVCPRALLALREQTRAFDQKMRHALLKEASLHVGRVEASDDAHPVCLSSSFHRNVIFPILWSAVIVTAPNLFFLFTFWAEIWWRKYVNTSLQRNCSTNGRILESTHFSVWLHFLEVFYQ